jgi:hypothetical protein
VLLLVLVCEKASLVLVGDVELLVKLVAIVLVASV